MGKLIDSELDCANSALADKDKQIATLKKALEMEAEHICVLTENSDCHMKNNSEYCTDTIACVDCVQQHFIQWAQEQEDRNA